ncbi:hypothetical protein SAMN04488029_2347 [Reichenbachiella faecimaris]|uniref:Uncharacterized protein n=1 Tax=Reichenbachiella faecimaris TaxID=692418 RepID=A0A1W2GET8_REIFA|nr:hypothetical protein [Reichenbachiella faecimaris]SMD35111.1 hypothetical protein SAMN04488029_2347 [Reichenbachiella faecimaris]
MSTQLENKKLDLIQWLASVEDDNILNQLIAIREKETSDWWIEISENEKQSIELGLADAEKGT